MTHPDPAAVAALLALAERVKTPIVVEGYDPHCTCGTFAVPLCPECAEVARQWKERNREMSEAFPALCASWLEMRAALEKAAEYYCQRQTRSLEGRYMTCVEMDLDLCGTCRARAALSGRAGEGEG